MNETLAALGLKLGNIVAAAIGSFVSLNFFDNLTTKQKWVSFIGGTAVGSYLSEPLVIVMELTPKVEVGFSIVLGLFSMSLVAQLIKLNWSDVFWGVLGKFGIKRP